MIFVVQKHKDHIYDVASVCKRYSKITPENRHILVIDDESDDIHTRCQKQNNTLCNNEVVSGTDESINFDRTADEFLYATYLAYTATPQANILQLETNPLAPTDFIFGIETPGESESTIIHMNPRGFENITLRRYILMKISRDIHRRRIFVGNYYSLNLEIDLSQKLIALSVRHTLIQSGNCIQNCPKIIPVKRLLKYQVSPFSMVFHPSAYTNIFWASN